jgi:hypothetical protein
MPDVTVDFVAFDEDGATCRMVLVEEGPWVGDVSSHLTRLQDRIYGCLDAALDGQLAERFPQSRGNIIVVQVDCYDLPRADVDKFIHRFSEGVRSLPDYTPDHSPFLQEYRIEANHGSVQPI